MDSKPTLNTLDSSFSDSFEDIFKQIIDQSKIIVLASIRGVGASIEPVLNSLQNPDLINTLKNPDNKGFSDATTTAGLVVSAAATFGGSAALAVGAGLVTALYIADNIIDSYKDLQKENPDLDNFYELASAEIESVSNSLDQHDQPAAVTTK